jgi:2-polyprenyl-3-methyl-5-hydroxy-6-metoxy-1,4-benzoquinol methylase
MDVRGKRVLDVGFGKGEAMICFKKMGANVEGINIDGDAVVRKMRTLITN